MNAEANIINLPIEILIGICFYLEPSETISLSLVCNSSYLLIHNNPVIWRFYCHKYGFVQFKSDGIWCDNKFKLNNANEKYDLVSNLIEKNQLRTKHLSTPKEEVDVYCVEFGKDDTYLRVMEYDWWKKDDNNSGYINYVQNIIKGKKLIHKWSNDDLKDSCIDISFATELINWRLLFYMNILNENSNNIFWLRIGEHIDIMTPITSVKIDPKIYKDMDESVLEKVYELAKKIRYLSTLHTCRHFIGLPCPMRIREIQIGGRVGNIITSEPNPHGRYLLELPLELIHYLDEYDELLYKEEHNNHIYNFEETNNNNKDLNLNKNKLQLPVDILRSKRSMDDLHLDSLHNQKKELNIIDNLDSINVFKYLKSETECRERDRRNNFKTKTKLYRRISLMNAFILYASNEKWKTSLTPTSISVFKKLDTQSSNRKNNRQLFIEKLLNFREKTGTGIDSSYIKNIYSNNYRTHSPVNCTTPCSVINRTCNLEFQSIKEYFNMLRSNSIIFNMFATSINLQDSHFESEQNERCWCEYPKSLIGCTWKYNPLRSNMNEIKNMLLDFTTNSGDKVQSNHIINNANKNTDNCINYNDYICNKESFDIIVKIVDISCSELRRNCLIANKSLANSKIFITFRKEDSCLADLIYSVVSHLSEYYKDNTFYPMIILQGFGWLPQCDKINSCENDEIIKRIYGTEKSTKDNNFSELLKSNSQELLLNLNQDYSFVNCELIQITVKDCAIDSIKHELKEQINIIGDIAIPVYWTLDGKSVLRIQVLPYDEKALFNKKVETEIQKLFSLSSLSTLASLEDISLAIEEKFNKCKVITIKRELNRFGSKMNGHETIGNINKFSEKNLLNFTNGLFNDYKSNKKPQILKSNDLCDYKESRLNTLIIESDSILTESNGVKSQICCSDDIENGNIISPKNISGDIQHAYSGNFDNIINGVRFEKDKSMNDYAEYNKCIKISMLNSSEETRQFEFHPKRSELILIGTSLGKVRLIDRYTDVILGEKGKFYYLLHYLFKSIIFGKEYYYFKMNN